MRSLIAVILVSAATLVQAAQGVSVNRSQEAAIKVGMDSTEVQQALGRPARIVTYGNASGPSWNYYVNGTYGTTLFGIDFGPDGKVILAREYWMPTSGG